MNNMKQVIEQRVNAKLRNGETTAMAAMERLQAEGKIAKDFIFEVGSERKGQESNIQFTPDPTGKVGAVFNMGEKKDYLVNKHAITQIAQKLKIPTTYLTTLLFGEDWQRSLGYDILNRHQDWMDRSKVLVRTVGNEVRAFLSDRYRMLNSELIFGSHIEEVYKNGGRLSGGWMDSTRVMVETLLPDLIEVDTGKNGKIFLAFGTKMTSSDYGDGALELRSYLMQGVCLNGMVRESVLRQVHLGAKLPHSLSLSRETYELDSKTTASAIRDLTKNLYSTDVIKNRLLEVQAAAETEVDITKQLTDMVKNQRLLKGEAEQIGELMVRNSQMDGVQGESTLWKLTQGISALANTEDVDNRRKEELQTLAGELFDNVKR